MRNLHLARTLFFLGVFTANTGCAEQPPETAPDAQPVTVVPQEVEILSVQVSKLERNQFADQTSARQQEEQPKSDQELIEGTWQVEAWRINGRTVHPAPHKKRFKDGKMISIETRGTKVREHETRFELDPSKAPKEIDFPEARTPAGKAVKGIYLLEGDVLATCIGRDGNRPIEFQAREGDENELQLFLRQDAP